MRKPNLFIAGAPRCGTTAMHDMLQQHPDIFMSTPKELNFFGSDLPFAAGEPDPEKYLAFFAGARDEKRLGESSVKYLVSRRAAREIRDYCGPASVIIMLRNPVDMMHSLHAHYVQWNQEDIGDFGAAVAVEPERRQKRRLPPGLIFPVELLWYREMASFAGQVRRYFEVFGRDSVHIVLYEDFESNAAAVYRSTLQFLGVRSDFVPQLRVVNANRQTRSELVKQVLLNPRVAQWLRSRETSQVLGPACSRLKQALVVLKRWNTVEAKRKAMDPGLRQALTQQFAPEVERLGALIGRDLAHWSRAA